MVEWTSPGIEKVQVATFFFRAYVSSITMPCFAIFFCTGSECEELELSALAHTSDGVNLVNISFVVAHADQARD